MTDPETAEEHVNTPGDHSTVDAAIGRLRRWTLAERGVFILAGIGFALVLIVAVSSIVLDLAAKDATDRSDCRAQAIGLTLFHTLSALADPPVSPTATPAEVAASPRGRDIAAGRGTAQPLIHPNLCGG